MSKTIKIPLISIGIIIIISIVYYSINKTDDLIVGTNPTFPPFEYIGGISGNDIVGFDIEIAKIIAKDYGSNIEIEILYFDELIEAIQSGNIDMAISTMTITDERKKYVDFSIPYYTTMSTVIVRSDDSTFEDITTREELGTNKKLGSRIGTTCLASALKIADGKPVVENNSWKFLIEQLLANNIDAIVMDKDVARAFLSKYENIRILPIEFDIEEYGIAVKKGNSKLLSSINTTLQRIFDSGEYNNLVQLYINNYLEQ